jgi:calcineurin-like phosphoesterase family protein
MPATHSLSRGPTGRVWFTSDLHFGHANVIGYSSRPFADVDDMNRTLVANWNARVGHEDTVWVLGDVAMGKLADSLAFVGQLAGRKLLLTGNHDRCWARHRKGVEAATKQYLDAGFAEIHNETVTFEIGGRHVVACHFPYRGDSHDHDRYVEARPCDRGAWLLHGHVHERWRVRGRMINVGVDAWQQTPVGLDQLEAVIANGPAEVDARSPF